jgi:hypothetical protein
MATGILIILISLYIFGHVGNLKDVLSKLISSQV